MNNIGGFCLAACPRLILQILLILSKSQRASFPAKLHKIPRLRFIPLGMTGK